MPTPTIRLPDGQHERLEALAENRRISVDTLSDELATIASHDARWRLASRSARDNVSHARAALGRLVDP
jgi:predicted transcriptional regulator